MPASRGAIEEHQDKPCPEEDQDGKVPPDLGFLDSWPPWSRRHRTLASRDTPEENGVLLTTHTAVRTKENSWTHVTRVKGPLPPPSDSPNSNPTASINTSSG
ncbi:hypothetical protein HGM15179_009972 [Zosterops borbonicus]|uniref:Uncharacterized protein n=1 Tax=Zosterops borbonicus TaxID=364589 RepID=A0A8K1LKL7_9PASS|nr:hypothetical protein HGM15179_009972 [Zosterops borbonicus]